MRHRSPTHPASPLAPALLALALALESSAGCGGDVARGSSPAEALRGAFPARADEVLAGPSEPVAGASGFTLRSGRGGAHGRTDIEATLPRDAGDAIELRAAPAFAARVRELGPEAGGAATRAERAVAYPRAGGTSFWTATPDGVEEWLQLDASVAARGGPVAVWEVEGATLRAQGDAIELVDGDGAARVRVTAPIAYRAGGGAIAAKLTARGARIELSVAPTLEAVLVDPLWTTVGAMTVPRASHRAVRLQDGRVLAAGGKTVRNVPIRTAELFDPTTGAWTPTGTMNGDRAVMTATLLPDGKVLVAGGIDAAAAELAAAELYAPATGAWTTAAPMSGPRSGHTATLLNDGRVLIVGGYGDRRHVATAEIYNPVTGAWTPAPPMNAARDNHTATLLSDGTVLIAGGDDTPVALASCEIYDPTANTWSDTAPLVRARFHHAAALLPGGEVLVTGGNGAVTDDDPALATAELYDPATRTWRPTMTMGHIHAQHTATQLDDGRVLVAAGYAGTFGAPVPTFEADVYDPVTSAWTAFPPLAVARGAHDATLLSEQRVLISGGVDTAAPTATAEVLFADIGSSCAAAADCPNGFCVEGICCDSACEEECNVCAIARGASIDGVCKPRPEGTGCDDDDACTTGDSCRAGVCASDAQISCIAIDACHIAGCDPDTGACQQLPVPEGSPCDDHNACTRASSCQMGLCLGESPKVCAADDACHDAVCSPDTGACRQVPVVEGTACDDHNPCTYADVCHAGFCAGSPADPGQASCDGGEDPVPDPSNGALCSEGAQCDSGFCVDGVCCDSACTDRCHSCVVKEHLGRCTQEPNGVDLRRDCGDSFECLMTCGPAGECVGADASTQCLRAECIDEQRSRTAVFCKFPEASCAGDERYERDCSPYRCQIATGACREACRSVHDCAPGSVCDASYRCVSPPDVASGEVGGCSVAATTGDGGTGAGAAAARWALGLLAAAALRRRRARALNARGLFDAGGTARAASTAARCALALALAAGPGCGSDRGDAPLRALATPGPTAQDLAPVGGACGQPSECQSGFCVDEVCCRSPCALDTCHACARARGATEDGTCTGLNGTACDDRNLCTSASACVDGTCIGTNPRVCHADGPCTDAYCDLPLGDCVQIPRQEGAGCDDGDACTKDDTCRAGACIGVLTPDPSRLCGTGTPATDGSADGALCDRDDQCRSAHCVEGVCCDAACDGACHSCLLPGTIGACTLEPAGVDLKHDCGDALQCQVTCSGSDKTSCIESGPGTWCQPPRCIDDHRSLAPALCTEQGAACPADAERALTDCSPYGCVTASGTCREDCVSVYDCAVGYACDASGHCARPPDVIGGDDGGCSAAPGAASGSAGAGALGWTLLWTLLAAAALRRRRTARAALSA